MRSQRQAGAAVRLCHGVHPLPGNKGSVVYPRHGHTAAERLDLEGAVAKQKSLLPGRSRVAGRKPCEPLCD